MVETIRKVQDAMYPVCSFHCVHFRETVDEHKLFRLESLLESVGFVLNDQPYNFWSSREDCNSRFDVLSQAGLANTAALSDRVIRPRSYSHLVSFTIRLAWWYKMWSRATEEEDRESDGSDGIATIKVEGRMQTDFEVESVLMCST